MINQSETMTSSRHTVFQQVHSFAAPYISSEICAIMLGQNHFSRLFFIQF
jgi:hypothetical protein